MKRVFHRAWTVLLLAAILLAGVVYFCVSYGTSADTWAVFSGNPYASASGRLCRGAVCDRKGVPLLSMEDGGVYSEDAALRSAFLHILGDRSGNIPPVVTGHYAARLADYHALTGYGRDQGNLLYLTVSAPIQKAAFAALNGRRGTVLVLNYETGEILCAASSPAYDPDGALPGEGEAFEGVYINRPFGALYTPGSVFKLVTTAAALETIPDVMEQTFTCEGTCDAEGAEIVCAGCHGAQTLREALAHSCNCAFAELALELGADRLKEYAEKLGVTAPLEFDGITVPAGKFSPEDSVAWAGIGQHTDLVNPCAFLRFVGAIAGGGEGAEPYLAERVGGYTHKPARTGRLLSEQTAKVLRELMAYNVQTVYGAENFPGLTVCAKSGTAEVGEGKEPHAIFAGFVQDAECPLAFFIAVENGGSGSATCTPIAGKVLAACRAEAVG